MTREVQRIPARPKARSYPAHGSGFIACYAIDDADAYMDYQAAEIARLTAERDEWKQRAEQAEAQGTREDGIKEAALACESLCGDERSAISNNAFYECCKHIMALLNNAPSKPISVDDVVVEHRPDVVTAKLADGRSIPVFEYVKGRLYMDHLERQQAQYERLAALLGCADDPVAMQDAVAALLSEGARLQGRIEKLEEREKDAIELLAACVDVLPIRYKMTYEAVYAFLAAGRL